MELNLQQIVVQDVTVAKIVHVSDIFFQSYKVNNLKTGMKC